VTALLKRHIPAAPTKGKVARCLFCKLYCPRGEWYCHRCNARKNKRATPEEEARMSGKPSSAPAGTVEQNEYSLARPLAVGRVGPFLRLT